MHLKGSSALSAWSMHLAQRDLSLAAISRAPYPKIAAFKKRMGWRLNWVFSNTNDFNRDYHVASCRPMACH